MSAPRPVGITTTELTELVLDVAQQVPEGRATTYGLIAEAVRDRTGRGSARYVGTVLARHGYRVPWWRVVRADGTLPRQLRADASVRYRSEGTPLEPLVPTMVDLRRALWDAPTAWKAPETHA
ncbi:MGMT family protein [Georgenia sp. Z1491]|uniref:MGMT family protein n=1 Tax=Georgenia sp. Z1491 TaxID=3416707 RepID=UPI003CF9C960